MRNALIPAVLLLAISATNTRADSTDLQDLVLEGAVARPIAVATAPPRSGGDHPAARPGQQHGAHPTGGRPAHAGHPAALRALA